jgi:phosphoglycolate phosphatase-like HAD superfamily hydrolase
VEPELLIWEMDGPVIDTSESYLSTIRRTIQTYFSVFLNLQGVGSLVRAEDIQAWKLAGGFHDPIELSAAITRYLLSLLPGELPRNRPARGVAEAISFLRRSTREIQHLPNSYFEERADLQGTAEAVRKSGGGRRAVARVVKGGWSHPLLMDEGEANLVRTVFLEIYLGRKHYSRLHHQPHRFHRGPGQIENETLLVDVGTFERLHGRYRDHMALVTSRTLDMALLTTREQRIDKLFDTVVAQEDIVSEEARQRRMGQAGSLQPPHPFVILEAAARLDPGGERSALYITDTPEGIEMATRAAMSDSFTVMIGLRWSG